MKERNFKSQNREKLTENLEWNKKGNRKITLKILRPYVRSLWLRT